MVMLEPLSRAIQMKCIWLPKENKKIYSIHSFKDIWGSLNKFPDIF